jgi:hypothetical protein
VTGHHHLGGLREQPSLMLWMASATNPAAFGFNSLSYGSSHPRGPPRLVESERLTWMSRREFTSSGRWRSMFPPRIVDKPRPGSVSPATLHRKRVRVASFPTPRVQV